ncbi:hypothetical protein [Nannocystis exedens]|uniref:hypothetical protein n=1 Tax=Nannocystis exedens TaxID=54 RepID=UPI0011602F0F|nr:hypothetical protein [Nannocystis exedens]
MRRLAVVLVLAACRPPSLPAVTEGDTAGATATAGTGSSSTTGCMQSGDCETDAICVAEYGPTTGELGGERGPAQCADESACIGALDLTRWCIDHQSCCGDLRCRIADGICEPPDLGVSTGETTTDGDTTTTTSTSTGDTTTSTTTGDTTTTTGTAGSTSSTSAG